MAKARAPIFCAPPTPSNTRTRRHSHTPAPPAASGPTLTCSLSRLGVTQTPNPPQIINPETQIQRPRTDLLSQLLLGFIRMQLSVQHPVLQLINLLLQLPDLVCACVGGEGSERVR